MASSHTGSVHPVLYLINRCDELARSFDATFDASCTLLTNLANNTPAIGEPTTMEHTLASLRTTLEQCEAIVGAMLACIYEDIPHLLDQLDQKGPGVAEGVPGNWNPKQALDGISQLFYVSTTRHSSLLHNVAHWIPTATAYFYIPLLTPPVCCCFPFVSLIVVTASSHTKNCYSRKESSWPISPARKSTQLHSYKAGPHWMAHSPPSENNRSMISQTSSPLSSAASTPRSITLLNPKELLQQHRNCTA